MQLHSLYSRQAHLIKTNSIISIIFLLLLCNFPIFTNLLLLFPIIFFFLLTNFIILTNYSSTLLLLHILNTLCTTLPFHISFSLTSLVIHLFLLQMCITIYFHTIVFSNFFHSSTYYYPQQKLHFSRKCQELHHRTPIIIFFTFHLEL